MTRLLALTAAAALVAGCAVGGNDSQVSPVDRCVERLLARAEADRTEARRPLLERYVRETYCERFDAEGWVHADGTLSIDAHRDVTGSAASKCGVAEAGEEARTVPCEAGRDAVIDCALLHHVRREEVRSYLRRLQRTHAVECDDGTPLDDLGAVG